MTNNISKSQFENQKLAVNFNRLIKHGQRMRATSLEKARGTCLTMSLEFCVLAKKHNIPVKLVMWRVKNDPTFADHWAVLINPKQVVDLTRIQVDEKTHANIIFDISNYPKNFSEPRFYSTSALLDEYLRFKNKRDKKLPAILVKNLRDLMLIQDLDDANHFKNFKGIVPTIISYLKFRLTFWLSQFEEKLQKRRDELLKH